MSERQIVVFGAGAQAREIVWLAEDCTAAGAPTRVVAFVDDDPATHGALVGEIPIHGLDDARRAFPDALMVIGIGNSSAREAMAPRATGAGFDFATLVHPHVERSRRSHVGEGSIICAGCIVSVDVTIGRHVHLNLGCSVSHDAVIDDFATLAPRVTLAGRVHVGRGAWIGVGATVSNGTHETPMTIGAHAVVGAGACVIRNVDPNTTVAGVPATPINTSHEPATPADRPPRDI